MEGEWGPRLKCYRLEQNTVAMLMETLKLLLCVYIISKLNN